MRKILISLVVLLMAGAAQAVDSEVKSQIDAALSKLQPGLKAEQVEETPLPGVYEVTIGGRVAYVTGDGRYLIQGELVDLQQKRSLTEQRRQEIRLDQLAKIGEDKMLIYPAKGERKHTITVFTDIDCPYCRRLHQHMDEMNALGIEVRYLLMPRSGVDTPSYYKATGVWCADKPREAMTRAKRGEAVAKGECKHPVDEHLRLAEAMGVNATPTTITERGNLIPGYMPPQELLKILESE